jgi:uncharacterized protein
VALPDFPYHLEPTKTGSVSESTNLCLVCGEARGYIYTGPIYAEDELDDAFCPWCIADGSAAAAFSADFTDVGDAPDDVPETVLEEVSKRTPGFTGWQQEHWLYHCGDAAAFLGPVGWRELGAYPDATDALRHEHDAYSWTADQTENYLTSLDKEGQPTAYVFRCRHCGRHLAYSDFT